MELQPVAGGDEQLGAPLQPADVFLALEHQLRGAAVGVHLPGTGGGKARHGADARDGGHKLTRGQFLLDQRTHGRRQLFQAGHPGQFMAVRPDQRQAFAGSGNGEGAHGRHAHMRGAVGRAQHQPAMGITVQVPACRECRSGGEGCVKGHRVSFSLRCCPRGERSARALRCARPRPGRLPRHGAPAPRTGASRHPASPSVRRAAPLRRPRPGP